MKELRSAETNWFIIDEELVQHHWTLQTKNFVRLHIQVPAKNLNNNNTDSYVSLRPQTLIGFHHECRPLSAALKRIAIGQQDTEQFSPHFKIRPAYQFLLRN